jgi:acyl-CoA synthetase
MTRQIPLTVAEHYLENGWWTTESLGAVVARGLDEGGSRAFHVHSQVRPHASTVGQVGLTARRLAAGLHRRGVGPGDAVAVQLPNWMEAAASFWAAALLGAVVVPIVHFYGPKEVRHILGTTRPRVMITSDAFGTGSLPAELGIDVPIVGVLDKDFEELLDTDPLDEPLLVDPAAPALIAFTSGTTTAPKGVIHSHQTLVCETRQLAAHTAGSSDALTVTPVGHFIGMLGALLIPLVSGTAVHMLDKWDPGVALQLMERYHVSLGGGPPFFFTSLLDHSDFTSAHLDYCRKLTLGGSSVPEAVTRRLEGHGITVARSYGSTEHPSITGSDYDDPLGKRLSTDGTVMPGVEIRLAEDGEILSRGPDLCLGYVDDDLTARVFDDQGWYHTGDVGVIDDDGFLTITDRKSDIIIRGGENVSAVEVEEVLLELPAVLEAVVVATPDPRLGERVAAVLRLAPGANLPSIDEIRALFANRGMARQKWPEQIHQADDFPRTASGKVQKALVRAQLRDVAAVPNAPEIAQ